MTAAWRILHLGCPCLASPIMAGSKLFPPKSETRPPTKLPRFRSAAFSDREQVDKPASLDGKGRPGCHERPSYLDAWLSCAGSGELAPEVGIFDHNRFGRGWFHRHSSCSVQYSRSWFHSKNTGTETPERLLPMSTWPLGRSGASVADKGGANENACFNAGACGRSHGLACACGLDEYDRSASCACGRPVLRRSCVYRS